ncbi:hypothetical protein B9Z55_007507 [Caenorhabditis nigoni]|nr:hypothetical protein B9Z55_007507 [Caenorhabditis nigoni]
MSEKNPMHKEEEESNVPKNGDDVREFGEQEDRPPGIVKASFDPLQFTGLYVNIKNCLFFKIHPNFQGTDEDLERILRQTAPSQTTSPDSESSKLLIRRAPSRAETTSSESSSSSSYSEASSPPPELQEEKPVKEAKELQRLDKAPELEKHLPLGEKPVDNGKGLQCFEKALELEKNRQLEKFENVGGEWERSDSFEAIDGDGEEYLVDTKGDASEGSIYVPTPKESPAEASYCLFNGEYMSKAEKMVLEQAMKESLKEQRDKEAEKVPVKDRLRFLLQQPSSSSTRQISVAKKTTPPPMLFQEQFENVPMEWYKGEIEPRPTELWIPDSDVPSTSGFTEADAQRATERVMREFYNECRWAIRRKQREMSE